MNQLFNIQGQVVAITGGTGVLGRAIAAYLAAEGARVAVMGRNTERGNEIVKGITDNGGEAMFLTANVLEPESMQAALDAIVARWGRVDSLLNAAGGNMPGATIAPTGTFFDIDPAQFDQVMRLNLTGTIIPTQVFLKQMVAQQSGTIVNFSSMSAFRPLTRVMGYSAAKAAVSNFTAYMAKEVASKFTTGIRVNAIAPGFFLTEQNRTLLTNADGSLTERGHDIIRQTPFGRFGEAEELCGTIHYLISPASAFVTGTVAVVDGGFNTFAL